MKKLFALILVVCMLLSSMPVFAEEVPSCGDGKHTPGTYRGNYASGGVYQHSYDCGKCGEYVTENCSGGKATCKEGAKCAFEGCNNVYTEPTTEHVFENKNYAGGDGKKVDGVIIYSNHQFKCDVCGTAKSAVEACYGGEATCTVYAICDGCGKPHGELSAEHNYSDKASSWSYETQNGVATNFTHTVKCNDCGAPKTEPCTGGEATCIAGAVCPTCGQTYTGVANCNFVIEGIEGDCTLNKCEWCDETEESDRTHAWADATCEEPKTCENEDCGKTEGDALGHNMKWVYDAETKSAEYVCKNDCGKAEGNHTCSATAGAGNGTVATCMVEGICGLCGSNYGKDMDNHEKVVVDEAVAGDCTTDAKTQGSHCEACKTVIDPQEITTAPGHNHVYAVDYTGSWKECSCGDVIDWEEHVYVITEDGKTVCKNEACDHYEWTNHVHKLVVVPAVAPKCNEDGTITEGHTAGMQCTICKAFSVDTEILTIEHAFEEAEIIPGSCTAEGFIVKICAACGYEVIENTGYAHNWDEGTILEGDEPTCTTAGKKTFKCLDCKAAHGVKTEKVEKLGHSYEEVTKAVNEIDCTAGLLWNNYCPVCETYQYAEWKPVKNVTVPGDHEWKFVRSSIEETCTSYVGDLYECVNEGCKACKWEVVVNGVTKEYINKKNPETVKHSIPKKTNTEKYIVVAEPTCTDVGFAYLYCTKCGAMIDAEGKDTTGMVELAKIAHTNANAVEEPTNASYKGWTKVASTCNADGYFETKCENCDTNTKKVINKDDPMVETKHSFTKQGEIIIEPVCQAGKEANGTAEAVCEFCGLVSDSKVLEVKWEHAHIYNYTITPDCGNYGAAWVTCENCDLKYYSFVAPKGECKYEDVVTKADCVTPSFKGSFCTVCGAAEDWEEVEQIAPAKGHKWDDGVIVENCTIDLCVEYTCTVCGAKEYEGQANGKAHDFEPVDLVKGDCLKPAVYTYQCTECGVYGDLVDEVYVVVELPVKHYDHTSVQNAEHDYADEVEVGMTCQADGITTKTCKVCGDVATTGTVEKNAAVFHADKANLKYEVLVGEPTCIEEGIVRWYCEYCDFEKTEESALGHEFKLDGDYVTEDSVYDVLSAATCYSEGLARAYCVNCGTEYTELVKIPENGEHVFGFETVYNTNKGCTAGGKLVWNCINGDCEELQVVENEDGTTTTIVKEEPFSKQAHTFGEETKKTYCEEGTFSYKTCSVCGYVEEKKVANAEEDAEHLFNLVKVVDATCEDDGYTIQVCVICGKTVETTIDKLGHDLATATKVVESTCTTKGYKVFECGNGCGYSITQPINAYDKDNHEYVTLRVFAEADCATKTNGIVLEECKYCNGSARYTIVPYADVHNFVDGEVVKAATCTKGGEVEQICATCNAKGENKKTDALGHDLALVETKADCFVPGTWAMECQREGCNYAEKTWYTAEKLDHDWTEWADEAANCEHAARKARYCELCNTVESEEYPVGHKKYEKKLDHKFAQDEDGEDIWTVVTPETCVSAGLETKTCELCETVFERVRARDTSKHALNVIDEYKAPTCTSTGLAEVECTLCNYESDKHVVDALGHNWCEQFVIADNNMAIYKFCYRCGTIDLKAIASTFDGFDGCMKYTNNDVKDTADNNFDWSGAHKLVFEADVEPECNVPGIYGKVWCENCGQIMVDEVIRPALEHVEEIIPAVEATCTTDGSTEGKKCTVCNVTFVEPEVIPAAHDLVITKGYDATCQKEGLTDAEYCTKCDHKVDAVVIEKLPHVEVFVPGTPATPYAPGVEDGVKCEVCGEILEGMEKIDAMTAVLEVPAVLRDAGADNATRKNVFYEDTEVAITGDMNENGYYPVVVGGMEGWMHHNYLLIAA